MISHNNQIICIRNIHWGPHEPPCSISWHDEKYDFSIFHENPKISISDSVSGQNLSNHWNFHRKIRRFTISNRFWARSNSRDRRVENRKFWFFFHENQKIDIRWRQRSKSIKPLNFSWKITSVYNIKSFLGEVWLQFGREGGECFAPHSLRMQEGHGAKHSPPSCSWGAPSGIFRGSSCDTFFSRLTGFLKHQKGFQKRKLHNIKDFKLW